MPLAAKGQFYKVGLLHLLAIDGCTLGINMNYHTTKAVRGPITKFNQSDYFKLLVRYFLSIGPGIVPNV